LAEAKSSQEQNKLTILAFCKELSKRYSIPIDVELDDEINSDAEVRYFWAQEPPATRKHTVYLRPPIAPAALAHVLAHELVHVQISSERFKREKPEFRIPGFKLHTAQAFFEKNFGREYGPLDGETLLELTGQFRNWAIDILVEGKIKSHSSLEGLFSSQVVSVVERSKRHLASEDAARFFGVLPPTVAKALHGLEAGIHLHFDHLFQNNTRFCEHYLRRYELDGDVRRMAEDICSYAVQEVPKNKPGADCDFADEVLRIVKMEELIDWVTPE
jgi:hypothetical protein